jgi:hypothetical protein
MCAAKSGSAVVLQRGVGGFMVVAFVVIGAALRVRTPAPRPYPGETIYPGWTWVLVIVGVAAGLTCIVLAGSRGPAGHAAPVVAAVAAAQLAGSGFVAYKHWKPASGMGGFALPNLTELRLLALVMGIVGVATVVAAIWVVVTNGDLPHARPVPLRILCCVAGAVVALALPVSQAAASADMRDVTSMAAIGLIYAGPWAVSVALVGWLSQSAAAAALASVALGCALGLFGPQMSDLVFADPTIAFATVLGIALTVFSVLLVRGQRGNDLIGQRV